MSERPAETRGEQDRRQREARYWALQAERAVELSAAGAIIGGLPGVVAKLREATAAVPSGKQPSGKQPSGKQKQLAGKQELSGKQGDDALALAAQIRGLIEAGCDDEAVAELIRLAGPFVVGQRGGLARAAKLGPERRSEIARSAALARKRK